MEVLTTIKAYEPIRNLTPVNKPYVININRSEELPLKVPDNPYIQFHDRQSDSGQQT
jgi:hypothetical protein